MNCSSNSSLKVEKADEIIRSLFLPFDEKRVYWEVLEEDEKAVYIARATDEVNGLLSRYNCYCDFGKIQKAIAYNAVGVLSADFKAVADKQMQVLKSLGAIKNLRLDQTSMRAVASAETAEAKEISPLSSISAYKLLKPYLSGFKSSRRVIL